MSNANPLIPQGSLLERKAKAKPHLRVAYIIVAIHLVFLVGLLIQGCKPEEPSSKTSQAGTNETGLSPLPSDSLYNPATSAPPASVAGQDLVRTGAALTSIPALPSPTSQVPTVAELPATPAREYVVVKGDSFSTIGTKFGVTANAIARANPGIDPTRLKIGEKLQIPPPRPVTTGTAALQASLDGGADLYVVKSGDNLSSIAKLHNTTVAEIKSLNGLNTDRINAGQKLKLPAARTAPSGTTSPTLPAPTGNP